MTDGANLLQKVWSDIKSVHVSWILIVLFTYMMSNVFRSLRWQMTTESLGIKPRLINSFLTLMLGYFANLGIPRIGEFVRAGSFANYEKIEAEKVFGTIALGRIMDVISLAIAMGLVLIFAYDDLINLFQKYLGEGFWTKLIILAGVGFGFLVIAFLLRNKIQKTKIGQRIYKLAMGFKDGLLSVFALEKTWLFFVYSFLIWLCYFLMSYLCFFSFDPTKHLDAVAGLTATVFGALGIIVPTPGGLGTYHLLVGEALMINGIAEADSFSFANIIFFAINIFCNIAFGLFALLALPIVNKNYTPSPIKSKS